MEVRARLYSTRLDCVRLGYTMTYASEQCLNIIRPFVLDVTYPDSVHVLRKHLEIAVDFRQGQGA